ncbi:hypothetical protein [Porphyromonas uenonis]|uniref:hypothetical protein n=1 Tax=Porphyromonas uenonis TaxID=281920 RepID=UPI0026F1EC7C|nr:hypothetical protein [Porphyromonas uenonis]
MQRYYTPHGSSASTAVKGHEHASMTAHTPSERIPMALHLLERMANSPKRAKIVPLHPLLLYIE